MSKNEIMRKYKLDSLLSSIPHDQYDKKRAELLELLEVSPSTFGDWRKLTITDKRDIPGEALRIIAKFFEMDIEQLFNDTEPTLKEPFLQKITKKQRIKASVDILKSSK